MLGSETLCSSQAENFAQPLDGKQKDSRNGLQQPQRKNKGVVGAMRRGFYIIASEQNIGKQLENRTFDTENHRKNTLFDYFLALFFDSFNNRCPNNHFIGNHRIKNQRQSVLQFGKICNQPSFGTHNVSYCCNFLVCPPCVVAGSYCIATLNTGTCGCTRLCTKCKAHHFGYKVAMQ